MRHDLLKHRVALGQKKGKEPPIWLPSSAHNAAAGIDSSEINGRSAASEAGAASCKILVQLWCLWPVLEPSLYEAGEPMLGNPLHWPAVYAGLKLLKYRPL